MPKRRNRSLQNSCKCPKGEIGACRTSANAQKEKSELAELLQIPKRRNRSLQNFCKYPKGEIGARRNAASAPKNFLEFAGMLQVPRKTFGVCRNAASAPKNFSAFAETLQVLRKTFWSLQQCCKHFQKCFSPSRDLRRTSLQALFLRQTHANKKLFRIY